jgi:serine/threonine-protein kinase
MTPRRVGNYFLCDEIGAGGMARVFIGRARGDFGFGRTVAIKTIHDSYAADPQFLTIFVDEARLASRIPHPNVVGIVDVIAESGSVFLVLDYVHGVTLANLMARSSEDGIPISIAVAAAAVRDLLRGLHAAHEAAAENGTPLGIVHRDVSPQNVIVGADGSARLFDFGVAKAVGRIQTTRDGSFKGKLAYMAPEQLRREEIDRRVDVFAAAVILWELLAGRRLFVADNEAQVLAGILCGDIQAPSTIRQGVPPALDAVVMRGLERQRDKRFASAAEMMAALDRAVECADSEAVSRVVRSLGAETLERRAALVARAEQCVLPDVPTAVAVSNEAAPTVSRRGEGFSRRWFAATFALATAVAALIAVNRIRRAASPPPSETSINVTTPPRATEAAEAVPSASAVQADRRPWLPASLGLRCGLACRLR